MQKPANTDGDFTRFVYESSGRNYLLKIEVTKEETIVYKTRGEKPDVQKTAPKFWKELQAATEKLTPEIIEETKAPSKSFMFDGAFHTSLRFEKTNQICKTQTFDHNNEPQQFKNVCGLLKSLLNPTD